MSDERQTVKVRIVLAMNHYGEWTALGGTYENEKALRIRLANAIREPSSLSIVTAELPLPAPPAEVPGEVEDEG